MPAALSSPILSGHMPPHPALQVCVVIPVRNEALRLTHTLAALAEQTDGADLALDPACYEVLLLANNCTDDTAEIAREFARRHPAFALHVLEAALPPEEANVGTARRRLMDTALARFERLDRPHGLIASTDGDTRVARDWVWQLGRARQQGAQAIGGRVLTEPDKDETAMSRGVRLFYLRDTAYLYGLARLETRLDPAAHDPWPRHHQFFGANFAVTADTYCRVGGLPRVPFLEDEALARTLRRADVRVRHAPDVCVWTSARQCGRVASGLSTTLSTWEEMSRTGQPQIVESVEAVETRLRARAALRELWREAQAGQSAASTDVEALAQTLGVSAALFANMAAAPFGEIWDAVVQAHLIDDGPWALRWPRQEITEALPALRMRLSKLEAERYEGFQPLVLGSASTRAPKRPAGTAPPGVRAGGAGRAETKKRRELRRP